MVATEVLLNEHAPHTLAEFFAEVGRRGVFMEKLPRGCEAGMAGWRFSEMDQIVLKPLDTNVHYFDDCFPENGKPVVTADEKLLFTLFPWTITTIGLMGGLGGYRLKLEPAARKLLKA